jgi:hypothetical protein
VQLRHPNPEKRARSHAVNPPEKQGVREAGLRHRLQCPKQERVGGEIVRDGVGKKLATEKLDIRVGKDEREKETEMLIETVVRAERESREEVVEAGIYHESHVSVENDE